MNVSSWLKRTATSNRVDRLDSELILAHALGRDKVFLYAHPEYELKPEEKQKADEMLARREEHEALAYILGFKEFYGRIFELTRDVLIPRPESEDIINIAKDISPAPRKILDVGTGSGCLAITLKLEIPEAEVLAVDISSGALKVAESNAKQLGAGVEFRQSNLLSGINNEKFDLIVANLPYVDKDWNWLSPELDYEPSLALYAEDGGLELIKRLVDEVERFLTDNGTLVLESDVSQHDIIRQYIEQKTRLKLLKTSGLIQLFA